MVWRLLEGNETGTLSCQLRTTRLLKAVVRSNCRLSPEWFYFMQRAGTLMKISGETWYQWACRMFEFENCEECGKGVRGHRPAVVLGNWFALCKEDNDQTA